MVILIWVWDVVILICSDGFVVSGGWICGFCGVVVVGSFNGWVDMGLVGEWWRSWVWVWVMRVVEKERDREEERGERDGRE